MLRVERSNEELSQPTVKVIATNDTIYRLVREGISKYGLRADLNYIDTSRVTDMSELFARSSFNGDISKWDVSNVTDMSELFAMSYFDGDISKWDVSNVETMCRMFQASRFSGNISDWNVSNAHDSQSRGLIIASPLSRNPPTWYKGVDIVR